MDGGDEIGGRDGGEREAEGRHCPGGGRRGWSEDEVWVSVEEVEGDMRNGCVLIGKPWGSSRRKRADHCVYVKGLNSQGEC